MWVKSINLRNFRNYGSQAITFDPGLNIFIGNNAQGKTNLLEAIYVLSLSKSYRAGRETELIKHGEQATRLKATIQRIAELDLEVTVSRSAAKKLLVNNKAVTAGSFVGRLNTVLFTPDSLQLIKGSPGERRRFLDVQICQVDPVYRRNLLKYQRVVRQRNTILKDSRQNRRLLKELPVWNRQLANLGTKIALRRLKALTVLNTLAAKMHKEISAQKEELKVVYQPFLADLSEKGEFAAQTLEDLFLEELLAQQGEEIRRGYTMVGPHRDDIAFLINNVDTRTFGSQGQQRTAVLSYILAEMEIMKQETGKYPVVLLDDVMSELDAVRRSFLLAVLDKKVQTIVTTTGSDGLDGKIKKSARIFKIEAGEIF
ncbi:MAG TPA: DNA replication/repair protein RecF [Firmicutes bacterium]|nr:DNA replication/repair protein RecF [Bacillota bacterium]